MQNVTSGCFAMTATAQAGEGKVYLCAVKDVCSRGIVGWATGESMTSESADTALRSSIARHRPTCTDIVHSDRGGQFWPLPYQQTLRAHGLTAPMGRIASVGDNAVMDDF